jgi:hypothetical protein
MSNPQNGNGTQATTSNTSNSFLNYIDSLLGGTKWGGNVGSGATLTYSFPWSSSSSAAWASNPNYSDLNEPSSAYALSAMEQAATRNALAAWANVANLNFSEITETSSNVGDLRFTWTTKTETVTGGGQAAGWASYPNNYWASGGDVWLSASAIGGDPASSWQTGGSSYNTLVHEIGHALGLKHPFGEGTILPTSQDSEQYSVMSYNSYSDNFFRKVTAINGTYSQDSFSYTSVEPSTPMLYDIAAMQYMYGANMSYRTGDDVYTFDPNTPFYQTLWDAGGNDTISISNFSLGSKIDLRSGNYSTISFLSDPMPPNWTTTAVVTYTGNNNLAIAYGAVIENAIGGGGNDTLIGNNKNNYLSGGVGNDTVNYSGASTDYSLSFDALTSRYTIKDNVSNRDGTDTLDSIEFLTFADGTKSISSLPLNSTISSNPLTKVASNSAFYNQNFKISIQGTQNTYGSGVLLAGGKYVLTAAHLFINNPSTGNISISNAAGQSISGVSEVIIHPAWENNALGYNHDLALIKLSQPLASTMGYELYRAKTEIGQTFTRLGFSGSDLMQGKNTYDAFSDQINAQFGSHIEANTQLLYDYDDGTSQHDAIGKLVGISNLGLGAEEAMSQSGFSGGATFIDGKIAGIGSFILRSDVSDVNSIVDSSVGELGSDARISTAADWIDFVTNGNPIYSAPSIKSDVQLTVVEPNYGSVVNYFLASFGQPLANDISFDYRTVDGSAIAGSDYIATQGKITLHTGESYVAIPVTILGDKVVENDETIILEITNPVGFSLPNNVIMLTATHTILNNDVFA